MRIQIQRLVTNVPLFLDDIQFTVLIIHDSGMFFPLCFVANYVIQTLM